MAVYSEIHRVQVDLFNGKMLEGGVSTGALGQD